MKQVIQQWEIKITKDASEIYDFEFEFTRNRNGNIINAKFGREHYKKLNEIFAKLITEDKNFDSERKLEAKKIIQQR